MESQVITIDGPAASGKSSVSRELAKKIGWSWVSTGAFYRGIGFVAFKENINLEDEQALIDLVNNADWEVRLTNEKTLFIYKQQDCTDSIFIEKVGNIASQISRYPELRKSLLEAQRRLLNSNSGLIAEGRDCGTVVFPNAQLKIYLTANSTSRAKRRAEEQGQDIQKTISEQKQRDLQDSTRSVAPMQAADDAHIVDTSELTLDQVVEAVAKLYDKTFKSTH